MAAASALSWRLHRGVTFADDPFVRWARQPRTFVAIATVAGAVDVAIVSRARGRNVLPAKVVALGAAGLLRLAAYRAVLWTDVRRTLATRVERDEPPGELRLTVVVPAFEEAGRIGGTVCRLRDALVLDGGVEILVVDDGSSDATAAEAEAAGARVVRLDVNRGKGAAVRAGVAAARGRTIAFIDADLAYPPAQVLDLVAEVEAGWDVVVGNRRHPASRDEAGASRVRTLSGRAFNALTASVLLGQYRDTQCGLKAFRADAARRVFGRARLDGFAFDVEVLHLVERDRLSLKEVPVTLVHASGSTVRLGVDATRMVRDLFRVRRWAARGDYDARRAL